MGRVGLFVAVRAGYDDLILFSPLTEIVGHSRLDTRSPEGALVVDDGGWVDAVWARVEDRVPLVEDVESRAQGCIVTPLGASEGVIAPERLKTKIGIGRDASVLIAEGLLIAGWSHGV